MRWRQFLAAAALLLLVAPAVSQQDQPYFSLRSDRTYAPGEKPRIEVYAQGVESLEFRLYRVNDPIEFFRKLEDLHGFGGRAPRLPGKLTWIERFHEWKREVRAEIRDFVRAQFSAESRARIRDWWLDRQREHIQRPVPTEFAQLPVLNPQQLVSTWRQPLRAAARWESATVPVEVPGKGLYLVEAVHGQLRAYTIVNVTELGIITNSAPGRIVAYVQHRISGTPIADCPVLIWTNRKEVSRLETNAEGLADATLEESQPEDTLVLAQRGDDFAVASIYSWNLSTDPNRYVLGYIYTDRPVYRPGHTVYYKGILRNDLGSAYRLLEQREVQVEIQDPEANAVYRKSLTLSATGTLHGEFTLPLTASLGYYSVVVHVGVTTVEGGFNVEEYKKPEYEVRVNPESRRVLQGEPIRATIEARYYFGEPVVGGRVTYVAHISRYWFPLYAEEEEPEQGGEADYYAGEQVVEQTGQLNEEGKLSVAIPTSVSDRKWDLRYRIEARVSDAANREISGRGFVIATYGSFLVNVEAEQYVYKPGDTARFKVEARDYDGNPIATGVRVELFPWRWRQPEGAPLFSAESATQSTGDTYVDMPLREGGSFYAKVTARTPEGREVESRAYVWVTGASASWYEGARERVQIVPDKKSYNPGEVAKVLIVTATPDANILVTTEGRTLYAYQLIRATGTSSVVEIPIRPEYAPGFYVGVAFLRDNQLYTGIKEVKVPPTAHQLNVEVESSKSQYQPGEPAVYTMTVRDSQGKPVPGAELSLGVVDEAIYAIRPEGARDILSSFYGTRYNRVSTNSSLSYYFYGEAGKRAMQLAVGKRKRTDLAQLKPEHLVEPKVRKAFPDTVFWAADLTTDSTGRAEVRFAFPDSLTTWRATARAVTRDTKVGSTVQRTLVRKNLILRLAVPRFFTVGDEVTVSALVHNYLTSEKKARVSLDVEGLEVLEGTSREVQIPSRGDARVDWRLRAKPGREVRLLGKALTNEESDALELTLPVIPFGVKLAEARAGSIQDRTGESVAELVFPPQTPLDSHVLEISVAPSLAGTVFGALEYLTSYPYGCTEQTMSSFLPNVVVTRVLKELGVKSNVDEAALQKKVRDGLDRLYQFQHEDGGWGWWQTDESHAFMTAYVLSGLAQAQQAGYAVQPHSIERARTWLRAAFDRERRAYPDLRAYLAYALAQSGSKDAAVLDAVWAQRSELTPYGRALLGLAMELAGDSRAADLASQLETQARVDEREAYWLVDRDMLMDFYGDTSPEATAYAMKLLAHLRPSSPLLPKAAAWLVNHRNEGSYWYSTKQTAMVIYGLIDYLRASGELKPDFAVTVWVNDKQVLSRSFTAADALAPAAPVVRLTAGQLAESANKVRITKRGEGRLYWSTRAEYYSTEEKLARTGSVSLNLLREYFRLIPQRENQKIVYRLEPLSGELSPGDLVVVRLTLSGGDWRYLMIEDPIPAGTEFIERDDLYEIKDKPPWWYYWYTRREFHDDRAAFFQTYFGQGQTQYLYLLKVVNPGRFRVSPARVQPMYQPQFMATTDSKVVVVK